jgi:hypothetical protein
MDRLPDIAITEKPHVMPSIAQRTGERENRWHVPTPALADKSSDGVSAIGTGLFHTLPPGT